jgi:hypothetical protein
MTATKKEQRQQTDDRLVFMSSDEGYVADGCDGRRWLVRPVMAGWRLEFSDPGDEEPTYAGTHGTLERAKEVATW